MDKENTSKMERQFRKRKPINYVLESMFSDESPASESLSDSPYEGPQIKVSKKNKFKQENPVTFELQSEEEEITEYELERRKNIEERKKLMRELGIEEAKEELKKVTTLVNKKSKASNKKTVKKVKNAPVLPLREKSLRLQGKTPTGELLPEKPRAVHTGATVEMHERFSGPLEMKSTVNGKLTEEMLGRLVDCIKSACKERKEKLSLTKELESFKKELEKLTLPEENVRKVVPNRIFSIAVHPVESKLVVAVGDKLGNIGLCDFSVSEDESVQCFRAHAAPVNCITFPPHDSTKMFSTSYDGTTRYGDLNKLVFDEVYASDQNKQGNHTTWHTLMDENSILIAHGSGDAALIDLRSKQDVLGWCDCHSRSIRTIQRHPIMDQYFVTSSAVGEVKVWDKRCIRRKAPNPVCNLVHSKGLSAAFFSSHGKYTVTTCNDDRLRVFNMKNMEIIRPNVQAYASHNTHTGRWLTTFKAMWHPQRQDVFVVGCMEQPRGIVLYSDNCHRLTKLKSENLNSVCSICYFHPTQNIIVGGNSSGRVHAFV